MPRYDNGGRRAERLPHQGDHTQDDGSLDAGDGGDHNRQAQAQPVRGGVKVRPYRGGGRGGDVRGATHGGKNREGFRGQGKTRTDQNYRGPRKGSYNGYKTYPDQGGRDGYYRGGHGDGGRAAVRSGTWRRPSRNSYNKNYNYSTQNGKGIIPVITTSSTHAADAGNSNRGWNDWENSNSYEHWDDGDGYQQDHDDHSQSWDYASNSNTHYDPPTRQTYQRDADDGGKRKNQSKAAGKDSKKAKVEHEPKK
jgi:hypothetical protein